MANIGGQFDWLIICLFRAYACINAVFISSEIYNSWDFWRLASFIGFWGHNMNILWKFFMKILGVLYYSIHNLPTKEILVDTWKHIYAWIFLVSAFIYIHVCGFVCLTVCVCLCVCCMITFFKPLPNLLENCSKVIFFLPRASCSLEI